ncbi:helix-turn-helix transcriptional regulator [Altererythrobacter sp. GH1-8]|uniref:helix-turn-helix transcriptional regulator n=1 Tax=Altererythrobacter sp. GH1-8 TaxID=3349333 RepID=UPI00374D9DCF
MLIGLSSNKMPTFAGPPDQFVSTARFRSADLVSSRMIEDGVSMPVARWRSSLGLDAITHGYSHHTVILQNAGEDVRRIDKAEFSGRRSRPGSLLILPAGIDAAWRSDNISDRTHYYIHPELLQSVALEMHGQATSLRDDCMFIFDNGLVDHLRRYSFLIESTTTSRFERDVAALEIAATLVRRYSNLGQSHANLSLRDRGEALAAYIEENLSTKLRAEDVARAMGISITVLKKLAHEQFGMPLHHYVTERRLDQAAGLISQGVPIAQVALDCGFASQSHLTSTMRARRGVTPASLLRDRF